MKTMDEALDYVSITQTGDPRDPELIARVLHSPAHARLEETTARCAGLAMEAAQNPKVAGVLDCHCKYAIDSGVRQALFSVFIVGLIVGITMERAEDVVEGI